jgi:hypothetical protein
MYRGDQGDVPPGRGRKIMREVTVTEVADVLDEAVGLYESGTYGWVQGMYSYEPPSGESKRCMLGIIDVAAARLNRLQTGNDPQMCFEARKALGVEIGHIPTWNDHPERTLDDVIEILKSVSKDLRNSQ